MTMRRGQIYPPEGRDDVDPQTGARVRQVTSAPAIHHHPFFLVPAYDDQGRWLVFVSERTGRPQIFVEARATGELIQLTDRDDLLDWSVHPSHDGRYVYFGAGTSGWRVEIPSGVEEQVVDIAQLAAGDGAGTRGETVALRERGMVGAAMGTSSLSKSDNWWAIKFNIGAEGCIAIVDTQSGSASIILRRDSVAHLQFCPDDEEILFYAGPLNDRVWVVRRDGTGNRRLYQRGPGQWITHESWIPGRRELAMVDWPHGILAVALETGQVRRVTTFNAWHSICNRDGTLMVADTNFPDIGLQLFDPRDGIGAPTTLCHPNASSVGAHWNGPFPYERGPIDVYAPQHTHPHPSFAPGSQRVVYTSDKSGFAQVYEVNIESRDNRGAR